MNIALIGATGLVGSEMIKLLEAVDIPITDFIPLASSASAGKQIQLKGKTYEVQTIDHALKAKPDIALFSAGSEVSLKYAPLFAEIGTRVIDNSSAWRMDPDKKLIVPEINGHQLTPEDRIIANPNCSTIQMVMALGPIHERYGISRLVISTYQSVTGTGYKAVQQMENERNGVEAEMVYPWKIDQNCIPHCDVFLENGYTKEEMKLVHETRKILSSPDLKITATAVRVPVIGGHSESVNVELHKAFNIQDIRSLLSSGSGLRVVDNPSNNEYPMPVMSKGKDEVFVGRIRRDESVENGLNLWIVADNLRKGAATNAVQIAQYIYNTFH
jgi:aspartate-semialdehyde dehydrogenase